MIVKQEYKIVNTIAISEIKIGECFLFNDNIFLCVSRKDDIEKIYVDLINNSYHSKGIFENIALTRVNAEVNWKHLLKY